MATTATFFRAGCPVCVEAEQQLATVIDPSKYTVEIAHVGDDSAQLAAAKEAGVESVPALVLDGQVFHINFGAKLSDLA